MRKRGDAEIDDLAVSAAHGNRQAADKLVRLVSPGALVRCRLRIFSSHDCEEIVQQAWVSAWNALPRFDPRLASFDTWFHAILHRRMLDHLRRRFRRPDEGRPQALTIVPDDAASTEPIPREEIEPSKRTNHCTIALIGSLRTHGHSCRGNTLASGSVSSRTRLQGSLRVCWRKRF